MSRRRPRPIVPMGLFVIGMSSMLVGAALSFLFLTIWPVAIGLAVAVVCARSDKKET